MAHNTSLLSSQKDKSTNLLSISTLKSEKKTKEGYIVSFTHPSLALFENDRYINPKMEEELKIFKKKIAYWFENA